MQIFSFSPFGYEGSLVTVEVDLRRGIPITDIVGLADGAVKESKERMQAAIRNSNFEYPMERVLISLSPADLKKEGAGFDLPIAISVLKAVKEFNQEENSIENQENILIMGELELSGKIRAVKGVHAAASTAINEKIFKCIVPKANEKEALEVKGMKVFGANTLQEAFEAFNNPELFCEKEKSNIFFNKNELQDYQEINGILFTKTPKDYDFSEIKGQQKLIRSLQIAASGGHNLIAIGAPGCGKTMSMQRFPLLLPLLTDEESQSVTRIMSLAGLLNSNQSKVKIPPFRTPHQTATIEGMCGGGPNCRPGEISLAHNGVLFLDEAAEFRTSVLQMLRVPMEIGKVTLSRAGRITTFPADFQLLMAANPCPCGNYGSKTKLCLCSTSNIEKYWKKFSAPLIDRVDLRVFVESENSDLPKKNRSTQELRQEIANAIKNQRQRQNKKNSKLTPIETEQFCKINEECTKIIKNAEDRYSLSPRAICSIKKIARTIADMQNIQEIQKEHITEAIDLRKTFSNFMDSI